MRHSLRQWRLSRQIQALLNYLVFLHVFHSEILDSQKRNRAFTFSWIRKTDVISLNLENARSLPRLIASLATSVKYQTMFWYAVGSMTPPHGTSSVQKVAGKGSPVA